MTVNVAYVFDDNYAPHACASIASVLEHCDEEDVYHFYLFTPELEGAHRERLSDYIASARQRCTFIDTKAFDYADFCQKVETRYGQGDKNFAAMFFKILFERYLPHDVERIISLDSDTIVLSNLAELYAIDLEGHTLGAVPEKISTNHLKEIGFSRRTIYFNSGVLVIDMQKWRERRIDDALMHRFETEPSYSMHDQDLLNIEFKENFYHLPQRYNQMVYLFHAPALLFNIKFRYMHVAGLGQCGVMHFTGIKPWKSACWHPYRQMYQRSLTMTPYRDTVMSVDPLLRRKGFILSYAWGRKVVKFLNKVKKIK